MESKGKRSRQRFLMFAKFGCPELIAHFGTGDRDQLAGQLASEDFEQHDQSRQHWH